MTKSRKIAAFTMVDILTGMVISSIIISMVFYLFTAMNKQIADYGQMRNEINRYLLLKTDLKRQVEGRQNTAIGIPRGIEITSENRALTYKKEGELLIRQQTESTDTLSNYLDDFLIEFIPNPTGELSNLVKEITVKIRLDEQVVAAHFYRSSNLVDEINQALIHVF
jgi:hypothetical protein